MKKTHHIYEDKKARRQQRRSLRESGDFLGVQGANPRTGYWDVSSGTSSTESTQMSGETKKLLDKAAKDIEEKKRDYEKAKAKQQAELSRVQSLRDNKKQEKEMRKKMEQTMKQRRRGKWKLNGNGWSSVAEPDLSPIVQSVVASPARETAPASADRLFPMPCAADPTPYVNQHDIAPQDDFAHRRDSSPSARERLSSRPGLQIKIPRKSIGSPVRRRNSQNPNTIIHTASDVDSVRNDQLVGDASQRLSVPRSAYFYPGVEATAATQPVAESLLHSITPSQRFDSFLDSILPPVDPGDRQGSKATVISYQSVSMSQAEILQLSDQSHQGTSQEKRYTSLKKRPRVSLKESFAAQLPLSSHPIIPSSIWAPPTIPVSSERQLSHTTTPTITTTGYAHLRPLLVQSDGPSDGPQVRRPFLQRKTSRIPLRTSSHQNSKRHVVPNTRPRTAQVDIATSSEHLLVQMRQRTVKLCQKASPGGEKQVMKNTPIFMSTFPQPPHQADKASAAAQTAALTAFQNLRHRAAMKKAAGQDREESLIPPKLRRPQTEIRDISPRAKLPVLGGQGGIESPSRIDRDPDPYEKQFATAVRAGGPGDGWDHSLVVWHPEPSEEKKKSKVAPRPPQLGDLKVVKYTGGKKGGSSNNKGRCPKSATPPPLLRETTSGIAFRILARAWWVVEPVFNPESRLRKRWQRGSSLTWSDRGLVAAAAVFWGVMVLLAVMWIRVLVVVMQIMMAIWGLFKVVSGF